MHAIGTCIIEFPWKEKPSLLILAMYAQLNVLSTYFIIVSLLARAFP